MLNMQTKRAKSEQERLGIVFKGLGLKNEEIIDRYREQIECNQKTRNSHEIAQGIWIFKYTNKPQMRS